MKKVLAIYFSDPDMMDYPFNKTEYFEMYQVIIDQLLKADIASYIVRGKSYLGDGLFSHGWKFTTKDQLEEVKNIKADLIFNRDDKNIIPTITDCSIINNSQFDELCLDKVKTFQRFPEISPKSASIHSYEEFIDTIHSWEFKEGEIVAVKQNFEAEGRGIFIKPWNEIKSSDYTNWTNVLVQEFIDSSGGIPGITKTYHDLRITVVEHVPTVSTVRTPKIGSLLANVGQGGTSRALPIEDVPQDILDIVLSLDETFTAYDPCLYSADFMLDKTKGWKLIELNSRPGLLHPNFSSDYEKYNNALVQMLIKTLS